MYSDRSDLKALSRETAIHRSPERGVLAAAENSSRGKVMVLKDGVGEAGSVPSSGGCLQVWPCRPSISGFLPFPTLLATPSKNSGRLACGFLSSSLGSAPEASSITIAGIRNVEQRVFNWAPEAGKEVTTGEDKESQRQEEQRL